MTNLSPAAQAILTAVTQRQYSCDPIDVPEATGRIKYEAAAVLRAAAEEIEDLYCESDVDSSDGVVFAMRQLVLIAAELEEQ
jgi:hypothetical protein